MRDLKKKGGQLLQNCNDPRFRELGLLRGLVS
jgi:hypothetical protein